ncbi:MAG TPA: DoxX family protein [Gemmatimonadaceae bacterium]|nr:DoxX family protein [Gemmatimonadaceae bacterium]
MSVAIEVAVPARGQIWTGRSLSGVAALFLLFDATIHLLRPEPVVKGFAQLGYPLSVAVPIAIIEFVCLALYLIPRTTIFGAILLTGYLGGAIAAQLRVGAPLFSTLLFPIYVALFLWGGLYLRDPVVRSIIPARR